MRICEMGNRREKLQCPLCCSEIKSGTAQGVVNSQIRGTSRRISCKIVQVNTVGISNSFRKSDLFYGRVYLDSKSVSCV